MRMETEEAKFACTRELRRTAWRGMQWDYQQRRISHFAPALCAELNCSVRPALLFSWAESLNLSVTPWKKEAWHSQCTTQCPCCQHCQSIFLSQKAAIVSLQIKHDGTISCDRTLSNTNRSQCRHFSTKEQEGPKDQEDITSSSCTLWSIQFYFCVTWRLLWKYI